MDVRGTVIRSSAQGPWVRIEDQAGGCGRCDEPGGCRSIQLTQAFGGPSREFLLPSGVPVQVGDRVLVKVADGVPGAAALLAYGLPLLGLFAGALGGMGLAPFAEPDANVLVGGGLGLALGWRIGRGLSRRRVWQPEVEVLTSEGADNICRSEHR